MAPERFWSRYIRHESRVDPTRPSWGAPSGLNHAYDLKPRALRLRRSALGWYAAAPSGRSTVKGTGRFARYIRQVHTTGTYKLSLLATENDVVGDETVTSCSAGGVTTAEEIAGKHEIHDDFGSVFVCGEG